ncbi:phage major capsid protein [Paracoccus gahaiensis]|uniref:Phage major capsid protein n=1 Tax=Paracoccus gahaiensis TaxID=1706839 RepID=A0A4U0RGG4_9RHOB|nr:phage major capsid protein [Paracoccus gahaiensis]TJZ93852.1 phage major capsid protein [Paracoccus gahaiensis]
MSQIEVKANFTVDEAGVIEGIAWPFGSPDRVGDLIELGAFAKAMPPIPMLAFHEQRETVGVWDSIEERPDGLHVKGRLLIEDLPRAREVRAMIRERALSGLSIGFASTKAAPRRGGGRTISALDLLEISVVAVGAHPGARITSAKDYDMTDDTQTPDIAALEAKMTAIEQKADNSALVARLDKLEAKSNRHQGTTEAKDELTAERKAFASYLRHGDKLAEEDRKALNVTSDTQGGFLAPPEMSSEVIRDLIEYSPIRSYASVRNTGADSVIFPTRGDITNAQWVGEMEPHNESTITFGQREVEVHELATFVDISNRLLQDAPIAETEVRAALAEDFGKKEAEAFLWGTGVKMPEGVMVNTAIPEVANGHAANLSTDALIRLMYDLPQAYRSRGAWAMNGTTLGILRTLKDTQGQYIWQTSLQAGQPETILGRPVIEMVDLEDIAANQNPIIYGDFQAYRIVDRLSMSILVDPYSRARERITRIHATRRVGGAVLQPARFRKLRMSTT